jgi:hypothetical protein
MGKRGPHWIITAGIGAGTHEISALSSCAGGDRTRSIPMSLLETVLHAPQQILHEYGGKKAYQSQIEFSDKMFLLRAIVADDIDPAIVVTVYRISKIMTYWRIS